MVAGLLVLGVALVSPSPARSAAPHFLTAAKAKEMLIAGVALADVTIHGSVDVSGLTLTAPFECTHCEFDGDLVAQDAVFNRTVYLSGSVFKGQVVMKRALFLGPVLFGFVLTPSGETEITTFKKPADFTLATFMDSANFDASEFADTATYELARFRDEAAFDGTSFDANSTFDSARFSKALSFLGANFNSEVTFDYASSSTETDLTFSTFCKTASFTFFRASGTLSFAKAIFQPPMAQLVLDNLVATDLVMDPADTKYVDASARGRALQLIESSAKVRGDLGVANDAYYRIREQRGSTWGWFGHALDVVFYRWVAGYLVVPWRPLIVLVLLALLVALWRSRRAPPRAPAERDAIATGPSPPRRGRRLVPARIQRWGHELLDALTLVVPRPGGVTAGRRFESAVYRLLFVCVLFGFANSNPTLRQMLDAIL